MQTSITLVGSYSARSSPGPPGVAQGQRAATIPGRWSPNGTSSRGRGRRDCLVGPAWSGLSGLPCHLDVTSSEPHPGPPTDARGCPAVAGRWPRGYSKVIAARSASKPRRARLLTVPSGAPVWRAISIPRMQVADDGLDVVDRSAAALGAQVTAVGIVAGRAGDWVVERLAEIGIDAPMAHSTGETRSCISILDRPTGSLTELYEQGLRIESAAWGALEAIVASELDRGDVGSLAFSGSLPPAHRRTAMHGSPGSPPRGSSRSSPTRTDLLSPRCSPRSHPWSRCMRQRQPRRPG